MGSRIPESGGLEDSGSRDPSSWVLAPGRPALPLVRGPNSCSHFLPFLAPALEAGGRGGAGWSGKGGRAWESGWGCGGVGTGVRKSRGGDSVRGFGRGLETDGNSCRGPALPPPLPSRSEPEHLVTLPVPVLLIPSSRKYTRAPHIAPLCGPLFSLPSGLPSRYLGIHLCLSPLSRAHLTLHPRSPPSVSPQAPPWLDPTDSTLPCSRGPCGCFGTQVPPGESC